MSGAVEKKRFKTSENSSTSTSRPAVLDLLSVPLPVVMTTGRLAFGSFLPNRLMSQSFKEKKNKCENVTESCKKKKKKTSFISED